MGVDTQISKSKMLTFQCYCLFLVCFQQVSLKRISSSSSAVSSVSHYCDGNGLQGYLSSLFLLVLILKDILLEARKYIPTLSNTFSPSSLTLSHCMCPFLPFCSCLAKTPLTSPKESDKLQSLKPCE